jgi:putative ABC transport system permease protein
MRRRISDALATLTSTPWRRAPWLLWRRPGVLATVAAACGVLAAALAAVPLFLSSAGSEAVAVQAGERCPGDTGATYQFGATARDVESPAPDPFAPLADKLGPTSQWVQVGTDLAGPGDTTPAFVLARDSAMNRVEVVDGSTDPGLWITDRAARITGLGVGDKATIGPVAVPVAGVYRDLAGTRLDDFWCAHLDLLFWEGPGSPLPDPVVLADRATFADVASALAAQDEGVFAGPDEGVVAVGAWEAPLRNDLTLAEADELVHELACGSANAPALSWCVDGRPPVISIDPIPGYSGDDRELVAADDAEFVTGYFGSHLPFVVERTRAIQTSVAGGVWPVAGFAALAGAGLVAAAASLWFDRRGREVTLLTVRGVSAVALGVKAVLELLLALLLGVAAGVGLAYGLVVLLGPAPTMEPGALGRAALAGLAALALAALTVGLVVAGRAPTVQDRGRRWGWLGVVPWEVPLGAATVVSYLRLGEWGVPVSRGAEVSRVDVVGLLFPVLFLLTAVAVVMRLLVLALRPLRSLSRGWPTPLYLAIRRVARYRVAVIGLVAASAIAAGVLGYAATLNRSLDATLQAKARTFIGSDVAVGLAPGSELPPRLAGRSTEVDVYRQAWVDTGTGPRQGVIVTAIDPHTFGLAAFWDASFADTSLDEILDRLAVPPRTGTVPAVIVGADVRAAAEAGITSGTTTRFTIEPVAHAQAFPGMKRATPTMFVAAAALDELGLRTAAREAWIRGDRNSTLAALDANGVVYTENRRLADVVDRASFLTVSWTFGFMQSLGIAAGVLVMGGLAVYLDARRRGRLLGYAFAQRMGLTRRQHRRALLVELAASVVVGCWLGLGIALAGAWLAYERIDPVPGFRPDPLLRPALAVVVALAAAALIVAGLAAALAQRRTDRDDPLEVLRAGA